MIKTALKMNIVLFTLLLIVSMPLVYADWSDLTVTVDTNVPTYDEVAFIQQYKGLYYIDYIGNKPYIRTNDKVYNFNMVTNYRHESRGSIELYYEIVDNVFYLYPEPSCDDYTSCRLNLSFDVDNDEYYITIEQENLYRISVFANRPNESPQLWYIYNPQNTIYNIYINNVRDYRTVSILIIPEVNTSLPPSFKVSINRSDYIDRPAVTYVYEHSDYTRIGAIILDSYNQFVDSLLNPLDTISGWLKDLANYIWSTIKRIIDPEGIFLK